MSNNLLTKFEQPLRVELRPSLRLAITAGLFHAIAAAAALSLSLAPVLRLCLFTGVLVHFVGFVRRQITTTSRRAVRALAWDRQRGWQVAGTAADWQPVQPVWPVFVSYPLVIARFRLSRYRSRSVVITADRLPDDEFRRLRVRLLQSAVDYPK